MKLNLAQKSFCVAYSKRVCWFVHRSSRNTDHHSLIAQNELSINVHISVLYPYPQPPGPHPHRPKSLEKRRLDSPTHGKINILFWGFLPWCTRDRDFSIEIEVKNAKITPIFVITVYSFKKHFSYIMWIHYVCIVKCCFVIKQVYVNRYLLVILSSLWYRMGKQQNLEKIAQFLRNFLRILWKITFSYESCIRLSSHIKFL